MMLQSQVLGLVLVAPLAWRRRGAFFHASAGSRREAPGLPAHPDFGGPGATFSVCYYLLIDHLGAVLTTLIVASSPIFSIAGGVALLRERLGVKLRWGPPSRWPGLPGLAGT